MNAGLTWPLMLDEHDRPTEEVSLFPRFARAAEQSVDGAMHLFDYHGKVYFVFGNAADPTVKHEIWRYDASELGGGHCDCRQSYFVVEAGGEAVSDPTR